MPLRSGHFSAFLATVLLGVVLGFKSNTLPAVEVKAEDLKQAQDAVKALGSDSFSERYNARNQLMQLGRASIEPLEYALKSEDPEVRLRSLEILIALRGRGFLGIGLQESTDDEIAVDPDEVPEGGVKEPKTVPAPIVIANQIVNFKQAPYNAYGVTKPFPAEAAGMQPGDKILTINDRPIHGTKDLMREVIAVGPARTAIVLIERGGERLRLPVLLTRNPIVMRGNEFGGFQWTRDNAPPVDLEREATDAEPEKRADAPNLQGAQANVQVNGQVIIRGGAKVVIQQIGPVDPKAPPPKIEVQVQVQGGEVKKLDVDKPNQN